MRVEAYGGLDLEELELLGSGTQGRVYRIDSGRCIKVFKSGYECEDELEALLMGQVDGHFPRVYYAGRNFIIRECVNGIQLNKYLFKHPLTPSLCQKLIELYESMIKVGYSRLDAAIFHIFVTPPGELKLIDTSKAYKKRAIYPSLIINGLKELGYKEEFLSYVEHTRPDIYGIWSECSKKMRREDRYSYVYKR
jgi:predicted Ser/Thr protein kinase